MDFVVAHDVTRPFTRRFGALLVRFVGLDAIANGAVP